jgi:serine/threonine-protein kinase
MLLTRPGVLLGDRYLLQQRIGAGGMGEVWRAEDTLLRRPVALKVLHPALSDDESFRQRFVQEARTVAALRARGVVDIYDIRAERGDDGEVMTYLVMEFLEGQSLHSVIARLAPMPAHRALPLLAHVADALEAAHQAGIVHRDIKPANIIVDAKGSPTILDFGIALRSDQTALTATGTVLGTVGYASPEQLRGEDLTGSSDLYSLGVVAYECLSGAMPFDQNSPAAVITGHLHEAPPPLPAGVPAVAARLVERALAKDPADRPPSAGAFAKACRATVPYAKPAPSDSNRTTVDLLVSSSPPKSTAPMPRSGEPEEQRRRGRGVLLGLAAVIAAVVLTVGTMHLLNKEGPGGQGAGEEPTAADGGSTSTVATESAAAEEPAPTEPEIPLSSVMVNAASGDCLIGYHDTPAPSTRMEACGGNGVEEFDFSGEGGEVAISAEGYAYGPDDEAEFVCIEWEAGYAELRESCSGETWEFTYLRTEDTEGDDRADFWQVRASGDGNYCLADPGYPNLDGDTVAVLSPCDSEDEMQQWRTDAG